MGLLTATGGELVQQSHYHLSHTPLTKADTRERPAARGDTTSDRSLLTSLSASWATTGDDFPRATNCKGTSRGAACGQSALVAQVLLECAGHPQTDKYLCLKLAPHEILTLQVPLRFNLLHSQ